MQKKLEALWQKCVAFHGHGCGGLAVGFRAVLYAWELFGSDRGSEDEELVCIAETDACGVDAIQALLSCTVGKGNIWFDGEWEHATCKNGKWTRTLDWEFDSNTPWARVMLAGI